MAPTWCPTTGGRYADSGSKTETHRCRSLVPSAICPKALTVPNALGYKTFCATSLFCLGNGKSWLGGRLDNCALDNSNNEDEAGTAGRGVGVAASHGGEMYRGAIGIIETVGQVGSIEAADAMTKAAQVQLLGREDVGGGYHSVWIQGDVGSVRAALAAGAASCERVGQLTSVLLIPRPDEQLESLFPGSPLSTTGGSGNASWDHAPWATPPAPRLTQLPPKEQLPELNVHQLRSVARLLEEFPLKGREISRANRKQLLKLLQEHWPEDADGGDG